MDVLFSFIQNLVPLTPAMQRDLEALFVPLVLKKEEYLAIEGRHETKMGFICSGVLRAFYRGTDGKEYNKTFFDTPAFVGGYSSLITGNTNNINIQALTDCDMLLVDYKQLVALYDKHPVLERMARTLAEWFFVVKEKREIELVTLNAAQRYEIFKQEHPMLENLIPQYHIASYLGVTPTQLSRIRGKK